MELGAGYVDVELKVASEFIASIREKNLKKCKIIVSSHNYEDTPSVEELGDLVAKIQAAGADIVKIATTALDITDAARPYHRNCNGRQRINVTGSFCKVWKLSDLCNARLEPGSVSTLGQPTIKDLLDIYNFRSIGPDTKVYGVIGNPVAHSKSPILYNESFESVNFNGVYLHLLVDNISSFFDAYSSTDFVGFSIAIPHKEAAVNCCDEVDPIAKSIGAINLVVRRESDGKLFGYNTDYVGAITAIEDGLRGSEEVTASADSPLKGKMFVVIGAGGAGRALAYDRARKLAEAIGGDAISLADLATFHPEDGMVLANGTSIGMQPKVDETPIHKSDGRENRFLQPCSQALKHYTLVFDAVYTPRTTRLLREAEECGTNTVSGVEMFIGQAYEQYERFTGLPAPKEHFRKIVSKF
ncbi:hypothetical protein MLD38_011249 [Melastoma candidum]|uniref:Uncharacterized protein n=1 Tax=Melastoma candidum TaxID=119954 RepID=A0ACB9R5H3_9MYRT|nr:hypothetical protein MLD38_011249 [Melastoma candidum]